MLLCYIALLNCTVLLLGDKLSNRIGFLVQCVELRYDDSQLAMTLLHTIRIRTVVIVISSSKGYSRQPE